MLEERAIYLEEHPTKANGYYTRDLLTLFGPIEELLFGVGVRSCLLIHDSRLDPGDFSGDFRDYVRNASTLSNTRSVIRLTVLWE